MSPKKAKKAAEWALLDNSMQAVYPLALMDGQGRYSERFNDQDAAKGLLAQAEQDKINLATRIAYAQGKPEVVAEVSVDPMDVLEPIKDNAFILTDYLRNTCGELTKLGGVCRRPVPENGEKCSHHDAHTMGDCVLCNEVEREEETSATHPIPSTLMITCANCRQRQHPECAELTDVVVISKAQKYDWQCSECTLCSTCNVMGDESKLMFCDACDRGYHTTCVHPPLSEIPSGQWLCQQCAVCVSCTKPHVKGQRRRAPIQTHWKHAIIPAETPKMMGSYVSTYCETCFEGYESDRYCPVCMKVYESEATDLPMVCCDECDRWVHLGCDPVAAAEGLVDADAKFVCGLCDENKLGLLVEKRLVKEPEYAFKIVKRDGFRLVTPALVL